MAAIASSEPFPGKDTDWIWLFNSVSDHHWRWFQRNGFSLHRQNDDYWMFLIPGVGEAPVVSFLLLVSLFAVLIGPVNYILLGRAQRLYLLLITVPAGAAVVTVCLFGYALVTDGLGVRLRARSFTELDQQTGEAAVWSRQSYYAAIAPSDGLIFPDDTTVFSIVHQPSWRRVQSAASTVLEWDEELGQRLKSGYLPSRNASQFMVQRAAKTSGKLVVRERGTGQAPSAENQLETRIHYLLLRDSSGGYYAASGVAEGSSAKLATVEVAAAEKALQKLFDAVEPNLPRDYDPSIHTNSALSILSPNYGNWMGVDGSASSPVMAVSILEMNLAAVRQPTIRPLEPGTYVAVADRSPTVPIGVPRVSEEASLHVIRGRW